MGLNISLGRKEHRLRGFFLIIPCIGIINGLAVPLFISVDLMHFSQREEVIYALILYGVIIGVLLLFWLLGKKWREKFDMEVGERHLRKGELLLLWIVGILMMCLSLIPNYAGMVIQVEGSPESVKLYVEDLKGQYLSNMSLMGIIAFVLTITIIALIMQGNKRNYYYEQMVDLKNVAEKRRQSVERMSLQMVHALASTIDAKDSYTNGHSTRVAKYAVMIAEQMGYSGEKLEQLQYAALLHDIGKIGIPVEIINKPSKLTDEEYEIIKTHPEIGANILKEISEIPDIAIGARWHHERYDGRGYPDGKKGQNIPEIARIIGVADAYDAMTSKRSYRDILPQAVVCAEIERGKSSQFDSEIAEIMIQLIKEDKNYQMHE